MPGILISILESLFIYLYLLPTCQNMIYPGIEKWEYNTREMVTPVEPCHNVFQLTQKRYIKRPVLLQKHHKPWIFRQ